MLFAVAAIASVSCQKEDQNAPAEPVTLTFTSANPETKTEWNEENQTIWWSEKDKIRVACTADGKWQDGNGDVAEGENAKFYESAGLKVSEVTAKFVVPTDYKKENVGDKECRFYAVYPSSAVKLNFKASVADVTIPSLQTSTLSFPNAADILYGKSVKPHIGLPESSISMSWNRLVAHAYITLKGINGIADKETINSITLTAQEGAALTGEFNLNVATDEFTADATSNVVTVNCTDIVADASGNVTFWACINPCTVTSLNIVVDTDRAVYTIDKTGLNCEFLVNKRNILPVNMSAAVRTPKDLTGAALPFEETFESVTTTNTSSQLTSLDGFLELSRIYPYSGSVKFSASSESGKMVTKLLDLSSAFFVRILSKGWNSDEVTLTVEAGEESKDITMITHGDTGDFVEYVVNFDGIDNSESITITTPGGKRAFVDNIYIGEGAAVAAPVIVAQTPANIIGEGGEGEINYTIYNQVEGVDLTATSSEEWLTIGTITGGKVAFTVDKNDSAEDRTATVNLTYGNVNKSIIITQEKITSGDGINEFYESFDGNLGKGGNDNSWSGSLGTTTDVVTENEGWTFQNQYVANKCIRFGNSTTKSGWVETPAIGMSGDLVLKFKAGAWKGDGKILSLTISGGATLDITSVELNNEQFTEYTINIFNSVANTKIKFSGNARFFLDEVAINKK